MAPGLPVALAAPPLAAPPAAPLPASLGAPQRAPSQRDDPGRSGLTVRPVHCGLSLSHKPEPPAAPPLRPNRSCFACLCSGCCQLTALEPRTVLVVELAARNFRSQTGRLTSRRTRWSRPSFLFQAARGSFCLGELTSLSPWRRPLRRRCRPTLRYFCARLAPFWPSAGRTQSGEAQHRSRVRTDSVRPQQLGSSRIERRRGRPTNSWARSNRPMFLLMLANLCFCRCRALTFLSPSTHLTRRHWHRPTRRCACALRHSQQAKIISRDSDSDSRRKLPRTALASSLVLKLRLR